MLKILGMSVTSVYMVISTRFHKYKPLKPPKWSYTHRVTTNMCKYNIYYMKRKGRVTPTIYANDSESDTCHSEDKMKKTLIKVKSSKRDIRKHENDTWKNKCVQKRKFEKLTKIEVQTQPKVRRCQWQCTLSVDMGWTLQRHCLDRLCYACLSLRRRMLSWTHCKLSMCEQVTFIDQEVTTKWLMQDP